MQGSLEEEFSQSERAIRVNREVLESLRRSWMVPKATGPLSSPYGNCLPGNDSLPNHASFNEINDLLSIKKPGRGIS